MEDVMVALVHARSVSDTRGFARFSHATLDLIGRLLASAAREIRMRRDLAMLQSLDDAMLHDIGLSRGEVEHVVRHGRPLAPWAEWR
jgi:uncharacterized protein YjiS (DUF1127 family)